jgi:hypothetical protein
VQRRGRVRGLRRDPPGRAHARAAAGRGTGPVGAEYCVMLDVIREHAAARRDAHGETEALARRHAEHFVALAEKAEPELRRSGQLTWHRRLDMELPNLRLAFRWSLQTGDAERAPRLAGAMWMLWLWQGGFAEGRGWLTEPLSLEHGRYPGLAPRQCGVRAGSRTTRATPATPPHLLSPSWSVGVRVANQEVSALASGSRRRQA